MTREEIKNTPELVDYLIDSIVDADSRNKVLKRLDEICNLALKALDQEPCDDAISRILKRMWNCRGKYTTSIDKVRMEQILRDELPSVKPQESSITWVTGADGAKIAFWDVPVWKVIKICEILGEPQKSEVKE